MREAGAYFDAPFVPDYSTRLIHTKVILIWTTGRSGADANDPRVVKSRFEFWVSVYS